MLAAVSLRSQLQPGSYQKVPIKHTNVLFWVFFVCVFFFCLFSFFVKRYRRAEEPGRDFTAEFPAVSSPEPLLGPFPAGLVLIGPIGVSYEKRGGATAKNIIVGRDSGEATGPVESRADLKRNTNRAVKLIALIWLL